MAIKGNAYLKTTWAFQERPVSSGKLNAWDDRIEAALELAFWLLNLAWGGGSGVLRGATAEDLKVLATTPPGMSVAVQPGYAFINKSPYKLANATETAAVAAPAGNPRIDLVQARVLTWDVSVKNGTEASSPVAPSADADCIALARIYCRVGMTSIQDSDDGVNGYVIDARAFI
jgi:hypothetical protein